MAELGELGEEELVKLCEEEDNAKVLAWLKTADPEKSRALLLCAAGRGQVKTVRLVLGVSSIPVSTVLGENGDTALHCASRDGHHATVQELLTAGGDLGIPNINGNTAMSYMGSIPANILEEHLNSCVIGVRQGREFLLNMQYPFLSPSPALAWVTVTPEKEEDVGMKTMPHNNEPERTGGKPLPETLPLLFLANSNEHIHLLEHPVITSFLNAKWKTIRPYFLIKAFCCIFLQVFLNAYVFLLNQNTNSETHVESSVEIAIKWITFTCLLLLSVKELLFIFVVFKEVKKSTQISDEGQSNHISVKPLLKKMKEPEEWLRVGLQVSSYLLIFLPWEDTRIKLLSATTILISWAYFLFFFALFPMFAVYGSMFTTISKNFFKVLLWLFWFVIAFALSFFYMFQSNAEDLDGNLLNESFHTARKAILKTIIMVFTGELDFGAIVFTGDYDKLVFLLFVFFIMLVMMNLLNGLAITDIAEIQKDSEIKIQIARMKTISIYEELLLNSPAYTKGMFSLITEKLKGRVAQFSLKEGTWRGVNCPTDFVPKDILETAKVLAVNASFTAEEEKSKHQVAQNMEEMNDRMKNIENALENISEKLNRLSS